MDTRLIEILFVVALVGIIITTAAVPQTLVTIDRSGARAAAHYLAARMVLARTRAVTHSATVALRFAREPRGITFGAFIDGNRNGVRARDILAGLDRPVEAPVLLADIFPGVATALSAGLGGDAALQLGGSDLLSFTPSGTATSGSVYIKDWQPDLPKALLRVVSITY